MTQSKLLLHFEDIIHYFLDKNDIKKPVYKKLIKVSISAKQIHSNKVWLVSDNKNHVTGDALVSQKKVFLSIKTADCLPILLYDSQQKIIAAIHAGWKGLKLGIIEKTVEKVVSIGGELHHVFCTIGPHIRDCCYSVPYERVLQFNRDKKRKGTFAQKRRLSWFLNLEAIAFSKLISLGVKKENIDIIPICTSCNRKFHSYRRDGKNSERIYNIIGLI